MKERYLLRLRRPKDDLQVAVPLDRNTSLRINIAADEHDMSRTYWANYVLVKELDALGIPNQIIEDDEDE